MRLHAVTLLSTHYHLCATDVRGVHPNFTRRLNRLFANFTKVHRGWSGQVFNGSRPSVVRCNTPLSVVDKIGYTIANPVAAGAVRLAREWPGVTTRVDDMDRRILTIRRPERYFDDRGELPDVVELRIEVPPVLIETFGEEESRRLLRTSITEHEEKAREAVRDKDWTFLGAARVLKISPYKRATAYEAHGSLNPTFATKGGGQTGFFEAVAELRAFRAAYRERFARGAPGSVTLSSRPGRGSCESSMAPRVRRRADLGAQCGSATPGRTA